MSSSACSCTFSRLRRCSPCRIPCTFCVRSRRRGRFSSSRKHLLLQKGQFALDNPRASLSPSPSNLPEYLRSYTSASDSMCSAEYEKASSIGVCKQVLRASPHQSLIPTPSLPFQFLPLRFSVDPAQAGPDGIPQRLPHHHHRRHPPLWFWVGTGLGN